MGMFLPQQYMTLNGGSRSPILSAQVPVPVPISCMWGIHLRIGRQRQDSMVEDVYYRILRAYASIRRCKHAIVRFATCVGSEREGKSSLPLCHVHHM